MKQTHSSIPFVVSAVTFIISSGNKSSFFFASFSGQHNLFVVLRRPSFVEITLVPDMFQLLSYFENCQPDGGITPSEIQVTFNW